MLLVVLALRASRSSAEVKMLRVVVSQRGNDFEVYSGDFRLGELHRSIAEPGEAIWQWHVRLTHDVAG